MHRQYFCKSLLQFVLLLCLLKMLLVESTTFPGDIEALEQVKASITAASIPPTSCLGTWNFSTADPCDSLSSTVFTCGFRCSSSISNYSRVIGLSLGAGGYQGILSPYLGNLTALIVLDMSKNSLHGPIPPSLAALPSLQSLDLSQNSLSGPIPGLLPPSLQELYLSSNQLQGPIPASLSLLTNLHSLYLDNNLLSGAIPPLANLSSLLRLVASGNRLTGEVPDHLPPSLVQLSLANNSLTGSLPASSLTDLKQLEVLDLRSNGLKGGLDARLLVTTSLQQLNLSSNHLTSLDMADEADHQSTSSELIALDLGFNMMTGPLPPLLTSLPKLVSLSLRYNRFIGGIPMEYALKATTTKEEAPFTRLFLDGNFLTGPLPPPFLAATPHLAGSLVNNCLPTCPSNLTLCQGGDQRPAAQCQAKR